MEPRTTPDPRHAHAARRTLAAWAVAALVAVITFRDARELDLETLEAPPPGPFDFLCWISLWILMTLWCRYDGLARGKPMIWSGVTATFLLMPFSVPVYLLWSRGLRGFVTLILLLGAFLAAVAAGCTTGVLTKQAAAPATEVRLDSREAPR